MKLGNQADEVDTEPENESTVEAINWEVKINRKNRFNNNDKELQ